MTQSNLESTGAEGVVRPTQSHARERERSSSSEGKSTFSTERKAAGEGNKTCPPQLPHILFLLFLLGRFLIS